MIKKREYESFHPNGKIWRMEKFINGKNEGKNRLYPMVNYGDYQLWGKKMVKRCLSMEMVCYI